MGYDRTYFLKKAFAVYPGVARPVSAAALAAHYARRRLRRGPLRAGLDALVGLAFLAWIPLRARKVQRKFGLSDAWRRQAAEIARARFADPNDLALFGIDRAEALDGYIRRFEDAALNKTINPLGWGGRCVLADKLSFEARCREAGLPQPATVAALRAGRLQVVADLTGADLVAKPADGEGGDGVRILPAVGDRVSLEASARELDPRAAWLIQARVVVHPGLADLSLSALSTVRVVTILDEAGAPEVVSATLRFASRAEAVVDNMKAGGLIAAVELETGRLGRGWLGYGGESLTHHPVTGAAIEGRLVPDWAAIQALARRAHAIGFADYALVGWDIAATPDGPVLIEGNAKPGVLMPQRASGRGLAQGRYGELLAHHLFVAETSRD